MATSRGVWHLLLEGFPLNLDPQAEIRDFFHQFGIQIRDVRQASILTSSNTPAWILTLNTGRDVDQILRQNWKIGGQLLILRACEEGGAIAANEVEGENYISVKPYEEDENAVSIYFQSRKPSIQMSRFPASVLDQHNTRQQNFNTLDHSPSKTYMHQLSGISHSVQPVDKSQILASQFNQYQHSHEEISGLAPRCDIERDFKMSKNDEEKGRTIEVHDSDVEKTDVEKYLFFFMNSRKGGGEIETIQLSSDKVIIISFKEKEVADHLVEKGTVMVGNVKVRIKKHEPYLVYTNKVLLKYPGAHQIDPFELLMYIKARVKCQVEHQEYGTLQDALILSFKDYVDVPRLQDECKEKPFKGKIAEVYEVKAPCSLLVNNVPSDSMETLQHYFEGFVQYDLKVVEATKVGSYLVHFQELRDAINLAERQHKLKHCGLEVSLYHKEIWSGKVEMNREARKKEAFFPKEKLFLDVSPLYGRFIKKAPTIKYAIEKKMKEQGIDFSIPEGNKLCVTYLSHQRDMIELVKSANNILHDIVDLQSITVPPGLNTKSFTEGIMRDQSEVKMYYAGKGISIVGCREKTSEIRRKVEEQIEYEKRSNTFTTEEKGSEKKGSMQPEQISSPIFAHQQTMTLKPLAAQFVLDHSFQTEVQKKHNGVNLIIDVRKGEVKVEGPDRDTVQSGQIMIHGMVNSLETLEVQTISEQQAYLLNNPGVRKCLLDQQKQNGIVSSWTPKATSIEIIAKSRQIAETSQKFLCSSVLEREIPLEPNMFNLLESASWMNEVEKLKEAFLDTFSITPMQDKGYLMILGLNGNIDALHDATSSYLEKYVVQEIAVPLQKGEARFLMTHLKAEVDKIEKDLKQNHAQLTKGDSFIITGPKLSLEKASDALKTLSRTIHRHKEKLMKPGMPKLMRSDKGNIIRRHIENKHRCVIETEDEMAVEGSEGAAAAARTPASPPVILAVSNLSHGRKVYVRQGDITSFTVDALVIAANNWLDNCGGLAKTIVDKGGKIIQEECSRYVERFGNLLDGQAMVSSPGSLPCGVLIHAVGPEWIGGNNREDVYLQEAVLKSLEFAEENFCVSIAIPGLSTGVRGYPLREAARVITKAVDEYFRKKQDSSIKDVYFCDREESTLDAFIHCLEKVFGSTSKLTISKAGIPESGKSDGKRGRSTVRDVMLVSGEIAKLKADVIVNSASETLDLSQGAVSKSLLDAAGSGMQAEVSGKIAISSRDVIVTNGYNLKCEKVYHTRLPSFKKGQENGKEISYWINKCLDTGSKDQMKSMMFPALGTGNLNYPRELVAECLLHTIQHFWKNNPQTTLTDVTIVLYDKDDKIKKAFDDVNSNFEEHASQTLKPVLQRGDITRFKADVIVNATDESLDLRRGRLSKSINDAAGPTLSVECKHKYPNGCPRSGVAVTTAGLLKANNVYHVLVQHSSKPPMEKNLMNAVKFCLEEAHSNNHQSILFPTLGVGLQGYKSGVAARCMYKAIDSFWASHPGTSLTGVQIVIFEDDTAKEFEKELSTFFSTIPVSRKNRKVKTELGEEEQGTHINVREGVTIGNIHFSIVHGDLLKEKVHCLVCSVHAGFDLKRGMINRLILQRFPSAFTSRDVTKAKDLNSEGYTVTEMPSGPFRCLLHFEEFSKPNDISSMLKKCIKVADDLNCISIALPALGQGPEGGVPETVFMEHLYDAVTKLKDLKHVKEVRLVILEQNVYERFMMLFSELVKKQGLKAKSIWRDLKKKVSSKVARRSSVMIAAQSSFDVWFFSDAVENIELAKQELLTSSDKEFDDQTVKKHAIKLFNKQRMEQLQEEARRRGVVLTIDDRLGRCRVKGIQNDTNDMIKRILEMCIDQKDDDSIAITVQWYYIDETTDEELVKYDQDTNKNLEKTYREGKETYRLEDVEGKSYIIDFVEMIEFIEGDPTSKCAVLRKDLLNAEEVDLPASWQLRVVENLKIFRLDPASPEFQRVASKFAKTQRQIIKIERIQNKSLYKQYQAKKQVFEQRTTNTKPVERELWHGTATDAIPSINKEGFNRSFCGKNAVAFGNGVYFAVDPSYSCQDKYARKDTLGNQYIYLVDVLTGEYTAGTSGMRVPPARDPQDASVLFDSVVNNMQDINMFIIFNDTQAYPKYLITFK